MGSKKGGSLPGADRYAQHTLSRIRAQHTAARTRARDRQFVMLLPNVLHDLLIATARAQGISRSRLCSMLLGEVVPLLLKRGGGTPQYSSDEAILLGLSTKDPSPSTREFANEIRPKLTRRDEHTVRDRCWLAIRMPQRLRWLLRQVAAENWIDAKDVVIHILGLALPAMERQMAEQGPTRLFEAG